MKLLILLVLLITVFKANCRIYTGGPDGHLNPDITDESQRLLSGSGNPHTFDVNYQMKKGRGYRPVHRKPFSKQLKGRGIRPAHRKPFSKQLQGRAIRPAHKHSICKVKCRARKCCKEANGVCVKGCTRCKGTVITKGCAGRNCVCCVPDYTTLISTTPSEPTTTHIPTTTPEPTTTPRSTTTPIPTTTPESTTTPEPTTTTTTTTTLGTTTSLPTTPQCNCEMRGVCYTEGTRFKENCLVYECAKDNKWKWISFKANCSECSFNNDPHFKTFDGTTFDWHGKGTYVISQENCTVCPESYVSSKFDPCTEKLKWATCVQIVYFQPEPNINITVIKAVPIINSQIIIDGHEQTLVAKAKKELTVLEGHNGEKQAGFGMIHGANGNECIYIGGIKAKGYLVKICKWAHSVFVYPNENTNLCGLCGSWDGDKSNDLKFRNGTTISPPPQQNETSWKKKQIDNNYGIHWEAQMCGNESLHTLPASELQQENPCNATQREISSYTETCKIKVNGSDGSTNDAITALKNQLINECTFDLCIATRSGNETLVEEWLDNTVGELNDGIDHLNYIEAECSEAEGFFKVPESGNQCFKFFPDSRRTWVASKSLCHDEGLVLAKPDNLATAVALRKFMVDKYGDKMAWLGAQGGIRGGVAWDRDGTMVTTGFASTTNYNIYSKRPGYCLDLMARRAFANGIFSDRPYYLTPCGYARSYALCEVVV